MGCLSNQTNLGKMLNFFIDLPLVAGLDSSPDFFEKGVQVLLPENWLEVKTTQ